MCHEEVKKAPVNPSGPRELVFLKEKTVFLISASDRTKIKRMLPACETEVPCT